MLSTCAATLRPLSASIATVAVWPTLTLPTSDSLSGTTTCIELRFVRTMNGVAAELEEPLDAPPDVPLLGAVCVFCVVVVFGAVVVFVVVVVVVGVVPVVGVLVVGAAAVGAVVVVFVCGVVAAALAVSSAMF